MSGRFWTAPQGQRDEADAGIRTPDPFLTMEVLYRLSYVGTSRQS